MNGEVRARWPRTPGARILPRCQRHHSSAFKHTAPQRPTHSKLVTGALDLALCTTYNQNSPTEAYQSAGPPRAPVIETIAKGAFGKVYKVEKKDTKEIYALKILSKSQIISDNAFDQVKDEVRIQSTCGHNPFIVNCPFFWQNRKNLFIVSEYMCGGELLKLCQDYITLPEELARIYVAEIALALASVVEWSPLLATDPEVLSSILGTVYIFCGSNESLLKQTHWRWLIIPPLRYSPGGGQHGAVRTRRGLVVAWRRRLLHDIGTAVELNTTSALANYATEAGDNSIHRGGALNFIRDQ
uniref:Protein kinase domain-containing protein n=1 Tax=Timema monikensis TaxID=170555 RepID=A0A7R9EJP5_9NEOP|nr:unnamed protein product [Timema monikensis]